MKTIYLDHAAATPLDPAVLAAMQPYFTDNFYNPSATYQAAREVRHDVETARATIAKALGVRPGEIIFTAGGTEANNLAIHGVMRRYPEANMLVSAIEHDSVLATAGQYQHKIIPVDSNGLIKADSLKKLIDDQTVLVSIMFANNEIGSVQHLSSISKLLAGIRTARADKGNELPLLLHSDGAQALNYLSVYPHRLGIDLLSLNGGKIYGPKQSGLLFVRSGVSLEPLVYGGGQEQGLRSGTENVPAIMGLSKAIEQAVELRSSETDRLKALRRHFMSELERKVPQAVLSVQSDYVIPNMVHLHVPGVDNERLMMELDEKGVMCAVGSACKASSDEPSHVLQAIGMDEAAAQSSLRFSMGRATTEADITRTVNSLAECLKGKS